MLVRYDDPNLERLEFDPSFNNNFSMAIVRAFRKVIGAVRAAKDERDFRNMRSLNFEKLQGKRSSEYSLRLNIQWRLIVRFEGDHPDKVVVIVSVEDYH